MKRIILSILSGAIIYTLICGLGWVWILGFDGLDWWKIPVLGVVNFTLGVIHDNVFKLRTP